MNEYIRDVVNLYALKIIIDALDNDGIPLDEARKMREGIRAGWAAALLDSGMPEEMQAQLRFPL